MTRQDYTWQDERADRLNQQWAESYAELEAINKELLEALEGLLTRTVVKPGRYTVCLACEYTVHHGHKEDCLIPLAQRAIAKAKEEQEDTK